MGGFGGSPTRVAAPPRMSYDTQTNKIVGSSFSPARSPASMVSTNFTLGATDSYSAPTATPKVGQADNLDWLKKYEGLRPQVQRVVDAMNLSPASTSIVQAAGGNMGAINRLPTLPETQPSPYSEPPIPRFPAVQAGVGTTSQIAEANAPSFQPQTASLQPAPPPQMEPIKQRVPIQTAYGTVYASTDRPEGGGPSQAMSGRVTEMGGLPAQSARLENIGAQARQSAAVKRMRERGAELNQERTQWVEQGIAAGREQSRARREAGAYNFGTDRFGRTPPQFAQQQAREDAKIGSVSPSANQPSPMGSSVLDFTSFGSTKRREENPAVLPTRPSPLYAGMGALGMQGGGLNPLESFASSVMGKSFNPFNVATMWPDKSAGPSVNVQLAPNRKDGSNFGFRI